MAIDRRTARVLPILGAACIWPFSRRLNGPQPAGVNWNGAIAARHAAAGGSAAGAAHLVTLEA